MVHYVSLCDSKLRKTLSQSNIWSTTVNSWWSFFKKKYIATKSFVIIQRKLRLTFNHKPPCKKPSKTFLLNKAFLVQVWIETKKGLGQVNQKQRMKMLRELGRYWKATVGARRNGLGLPVSSFKITLFVMNWSGIQIKFT